MTTNTFVALLLLASSTWPNVAAQSTSSNSSMPTATVTNGTIIGTTTSIPSATAPVNKFLGVPFAQSPPQRFSPAQPAEAFNGSLMAQSYSPACLQQFNYPEPIRNFTESVFNYPPPPAGESEDCLYLNVFAPSTPAPPGGRAVMFWIFGGGFQFGTGTLPLYDGSAFAAYNDVILVTHNYRTNAFGFLASSDLPATGRNLGLLDQRMAMQWVQENIAAFGGDPSKVTIFGESAGGFSVDAHLTSFNTEDAPFRAAILESGQLSFTSSPFTSLNNDESVMALAQNLSCTGNTLDCLRRVTAMSIKDAIEHNGLDFGAVIDNYTVHSNAAARRMSGNVAQVPILIGTNANEGRIFELGQMNVTSYVQSAIGSLAPDLVAQVLAAFPTNSSVSDYDQVSTIFTLLNFQCGTAYLAQQNARANVSTWRYLYNASFPNLSPIDGLLRAYHGSEIPLVFQTYPGGPLDSIPPVNGTDLPLALPVTAQQYALGQYMNWAWATFAKNPALGPNWGRVEAGASPSSVSLDIAILGGSQGTAAGAELANATTIDGSCNLFRPLFEMFSNVSLADYNL